MPSRLTLTSHPPPDVLDQGWRTCRDPVVRSHWHIVWLVSQGHSGAAVTRLSCHTLRTDRTTIHDLTCYHWWPSHAPPDSVN